VYYEGDMVTPEELAEAVYPRRPKFLSMQEVVILGSEGEEYKLIQTGTCKFHIVCLYTLNRVFDEQLINIGRAGEIDLGSLEVFLSVRGYKLKETWKCL
jgi:hypothetical protein